LNSNLHERLVSIGGDVIGPFREWKRINEERAKLNNTNFTIPFDIIAKNFLSKSKTKEFFQLIEMNDGHRYYKDSKEEKRFHKTDGVIFTPNTPYQLKKAPTLYKWKYAELQSIGIYFVC
jgi:hypothetical protein